MTRENEFEPRLGRQRSGGGNRARRYLQRVLAATNLARAGAALAGRGAGTQRGSRIGRAGGIGRLLAAHPGGVAPGRRRVVIKTSIVRLAGKGANGALAHLRYLQRDGTTRDGERGTLFGAVEDAVDGREFHDRGSGDRHQFRFIVSPEDGAEYDTLRPLVRRLMAQAEIDLGTRLEWVAVDHFNTAHPHAHIVVRGIDQTGHDLVIAPDYLTRGLRVRAAELVELDLGPRPDRDIARGQMGEIEQERLTAIDRRLIATADPDRIVVAQAPGAFEQTLRAGRLAKLARLGLAQALPGGRWQLNPDLADTLTRIGERHDIIRTMQRGFTAAKVERAAADLTIYDSATADAPPLVGRVVRRGLADEHRDRHYLLVDGIDGRSHYVDIGKGDPDDGARENAIVEITARTGGLRAADRTIVAVAAAHEGRYDVDAHLGHDPSASQEFAESHVRRLEAMRRAGVGVEREASGSWRIAPDHLERVERFEAARLRTRPVEVQLLAGEPLAQLAVVEGASWLDHRIAGGEGPAARDAGFGAELRAAESRRRQWLIEQGLGVQDAGGFRAAPGMIETLRRRELLRVAAGLSRELDLPFAEVRPGASIEGVFRRRLDLASGRHALIERAHDFTLVPWRPVLERHVGKPVSGILRSDGISWAIGRGRAGPSIS